MSEKKRRERVHWIPDIINVRGTTIGVSYNRTFLYPGFQRNEIASRAKIRIDYKRVFLISEFLISGIHCIVNNCVYNNDVYNECFRDEATLRIQCALIICI